MNDNENMAGSSSSPISSAAPQSPDIGDSTNGINFTNTAALPSLISQSAKKGRGRPRKYHTDAEREEAKRRYRENHKTKAATGTLGVSAAAAQPPAPTQQDVDELWEAVRGLQDEIAGLKMQLAQRDAAAAAALPGQKRKKV
ncbi:hypothetical protein D6C85_10600 [Aureobasidium pullulans]|uniref:Uncharacterized protein n=1 Tax=Aureobasidium pullulans TaxID=5580 RepID=A0A4V4KU40_AURPU|nr:hypothetical protein D6C85_10600 [Aureobasidium pullulans]